MRIEEIELENFKSHQSIDLPLKKFTIIIGPNSSGKSSILQSMLILKNTINNKTYSGVTIRNESYDFGNFEDVVTLGHDINNITIGLQGIKPLPNGFSDPTSELAKFGYSLTFGKNGPVSVYLGITIGEYTLTFSWGIDNDEPKCSLVSKYNQAPVKISYIRIDGIHPIMQISENTILAKNFNAMFNTGNFTRTLLDDFHYVPFHRTVTRYGAPLTRTSGDLLSVTPEGLMSATLSKLSKDTKLLDKVSDFMKQLTGKTVRPKNFDVPSSNEQGVTLEFIKNGFSNAISNEGTGPNQAILLLSIILGTPKNSVIAIDEPEIHLHPKAQSKLAKILMDVAEKESKQFIFATHSEHMIYPFLASIASKKQSHLTYQQLAVYYFDQSEKSNISTIEKLEVNKHGQLRGGLKGFWDTDLDAISEFLDEKNV